MSHRSADQMICLPMDQAPKDSTMICLLVEPDREAFTTFEDSLDPCWTIGFNQLKHTGEDLWEFVGWDWSHDCFTNGHGTVIGWAPFKPLRAIED